MKAQAKIPQMLPLKKRISRIFTSSSVSSKSFGDISSSDFSKPSSSSLAPSMEACSVKIDAENLRRRPGQTAGTEVAYRGLAGSPCFYAPLRAMKIRQAPGALATTQNHLQYYQQPSHTLTAAVWA
eukprot:1157027-Pelagomonas_calceolata.AAC.3